MLHEVGECLMSLEVQPVFVYPAHWGDHHDIAVIVERHHCQRVVLLGEPGDLNV
jgi:hypothetical protein